MSTLDKKYTEVLNKTGSIVYTYTCYKTGSIVYICTCYKTGIIVYTCTCYIILSLLYNMFSTIQKCISNYEKKCFVKFIYQYSIII